MTKHDKTVGCWGLFGTLCIFGFALLLAYWGSYMDKQANDGKEESSVYLEESNLDDIRDDLTDIAILINDQQYVTVDQVMGVLQDYLNDEED